MKIAKYWILSIVTGIFVACEMSNPDVQYTITQCASIPSPRASATSFVIDNYAYVFGGRDSEGNYLNDLWKYDPQKDIWESLGITPLQSRVNATSCVCDGVAYIGLGFNGLYYNSTGYLTDWWSYDPINNQWKQLSNFPGNTTARAISMAGDGELIVGYGFCYTYERDMYHYDITKDTWTFIDVHLDRNPLTFPMRSFGGVGAACQGRYFAGTGFRKHSLSWWGEFHTEGKWTKCKDIPNGRTTAACTSTQDFVYVIGGMHWGGVNTTGKVLEDIQQYDPQNNSWRNVGRLPNGGLFNHIAFSIGNQIYVGLGEDENFIINNRLYCIHEK
jgi:N-acetylneuraminic acid mutarotase